MGRRMYNMLYKFTDKDSDNTINLTSVEYFFIHKSTKNELTICNNGKFHYISNMNNNAIDDFMDAINKSSLHEMYLFSDVPDILFGKIDIYVNILAIDSYRYKDGIVEIFIGDNHFGAYASQEEYEKFDKFMIGYFGIFDGKKDKI